MNIPTDLLPLPPSECWCTSTQRFIYNSTTGALFFDQDGNAGAFTQVQFAQIQHLRLL